MLWPFWTDAMIHLAPSTPVWGPWVLVVVGLCAQAIGILMAARPSTAQRAFAVEQPELVGEQSNTDADSIGFLIPVLGAEVPDDPQLLPGADRAYRGGRHEGVDFSCDPGTPVRAAAAGYVLSIDDEPNLPQHRRQELIQYCRSRGQTPGEVLEVLHGRRVVLCHGTTHGELTTTGYSHLERIEPTLYPGCEVEAGQLIGWAGNSGTSHAYGRDGWGELHFELRRDGRAVGVGLPAHQIAALYRDYLRRKKP